SDRRLWSRWCLLCCMSLTERAGFEPAIGFKPNTAFPVLLLRPLGHLSQAVSGSPDGGPDILTRAGVRFYGRVDSDCPVEAARATVGSAAASIATPDAAFAGPQRPQLLAAIKKWRRDNGCP